MFNNRHLKRLLKMLSELLLAIGIGLILYAFYKWATLNHDYFVKRNLPYIKPGTPFGSLAGVFFQRITATEFSQKMYNLFPNEKMYGLFDFRTPFVIVRDPELLKQLAVKDFDHFEDHRAFIDTEVDELFGNSLIMMKGQRWRDMRAKLSPAFTGSKMRQMFDLVSECADDMAKYFVKQLNEGKKIDLEIKDLFSRYTNDVIASCAFGIKVNSFENPNNEFFVTGKKFMNFNRPLAIFRYLFMRVFPSLARKLKIRFLSASVSEFFTKIVIDTMDERKKRGICRPDMINILMQVRQGKITQETAAEQIENAQRDSAGFATVEESSIGQKGPQRQWTDKEIISQAFLFFLAGFETTSTTLIFLMYEICVNPDVQQKLYEEIAETNANLDGNRISYGTLQKMKYLDQVVCESLRKWTSSIFLERLCVKDYECEYGDNKKFRFEKDVAFWMPVYGMHHDPKYYPEPEKFDPERFSDENKHLIVPGTYLPFGVGPRNCIGSRFALMELKAILYHILLNLSLVPNAKSQIPLKLKKSAFSMQTEKGIYMDFIPRETASNFLRSEKVDICPK